MPILGRERWLIGLGLLFMKGKAIPRFGKFCLRVRAPISWGRGGVDGCEIWVDDWTLLDGVTCNGVTSDGAYSLLDDAARSCAETDSSGVRTADVWSSANALESGAIPWVADRMEAAGRDYMVVPPRGRED
jgi:hypothetical protein